MSNPQRKKQAQKDSAFDEGSSFSKDSRAMLFNAGVAFGGQYQSRMSRDTVARTLPGDFSEPADRLERDLCGSPTRKKAKPSSQTSPNRPAVPPGGPGCIGACPCCGGRCWARSFSGRTGQTLEVEDLLLAKQKLRRATCPDICECLALSKSDASLHWANIQAVPQEMLSVQNLMHCLYTSNSERQLAD